LIATTHSGRSRPACGWGCATRARLKDRRQQRQDRRREANSPRRLLLLTAQRRDKVATMKWDDIEDGVWAIVAEPREKGHAGRSVCSRTPSTSFAARRLVLIIALPSGLALPRPPTFAGGRMPWMMQHVLGAELNCPELSLLELCLDWSSGDNEPVEQEVILNKPFGARSAKTALQLCTPAHVSYGSWDSDR
jgi:hypothetical protein